MKKDAEESKLHRMAKVHDILEMWQGSHILCATQKKSRVQNKQINAVEYILDTEEIFKASWSLLQHDGVAPFKLSERSPLPPPWSAKDLPGGQTQMLNACQIRRINRHPVENDEDSAPETISGTEDWHNWNGDLDDPNDSEEDCAVDVESDMEQDSTNEDPECPEQWDVSAAPNVPGLIRLTLRSRRQVEKVLATINPIKTRRNKGVKRN